MGRIRVVDTRELARRDRETFHDSPVKKEEQLRAKWPDRFVDIGRGYGVLYRSDKWNTVDTYKHLRESNWRMLVNPKYKLNWEDGDNLLRNPDMTTEYEVEGLMPKHVAYLGRCLGAQGILSDGRIVHIEMPGSHWGAVRVPGDKHTVLVAYSSMINMIIVGDDLDIERDGIVG